MKKTFKKYGELKYITAEDWTNLSLNPYRFMEEYARAEDGTVCEIFSCGNAAKKLNIPQFVSVQP